MTRPAPKTRTIALVCDARTLGRLEDEARARDVPRDTLISAILSRWLYGGYGWAAEPKTTRDQK